MNESVNEIAQKLGGTVVGDGSVRITGFNGLKEADDGDLSFLSDPRYTSYLETTKAAAVLVPPDCDDSRRPIIRVTDPYRAFAAILRDYQKESLVHPQGIHDTAVIGDNVQFGKNVSLDAYVRIADECVIGDDVVMYAGAYVGRGTRIGDSTIIYPNVSIREHIVIGSRCIIHSGVGIGGDGFGFESGNGVHEKIPQVGIVVIGDDVEIGANATIDRATCGRTIIGTGTKIDNQVVIGHNVRIGEHCVISGNCGIAGSTTIGDRVTIGGMSAIRGHIEIGDDVMIGAFSGVVRSLEPGSTVSGHPAFDHGITKRIYVSMKRLPETTRQIRKLEKRIAELEKEDG